MRLPFRRSTSLPAGVLQKTAARAGLVRLAIRQRTLHPRPMKRMFRSFPGRS